MIDGAKEAIKYQMHFRRKQLTTHDVELAIKDQNLFRVSPMP